MTGSERARELRRRRHRRKKIEHLKKKAEKAPPSEQAAIAQKIRRLTPGGNIIVERLGLEER